MVYYPPQEPMRQQPQSPPPPYVPPKPATSHYLIDCLNQYTYVWLVNGEGFWYYPITVQYGAVTGYRWNGTFWTFYGFDERFIETVACYPVPTLY
ncbi:transporter [Neobacillus bataviensis]|uniref:transporter n=1 Tax=Neobacillus bataviensis TaxID=220685 RepID=UPI001CBC8E82|nr:transporter [Neobacillus bataviensis]